MILYADAVPADGLELAETAKRAFTETFGSLYRAEDLARFIDETFGAAGLPSQIGDPRFAIRVARDDGKLIGFVKLGPVAFPGEWSATDIELHQLYVLGGWHGEGVGPTLMQWAIDRARGDGYRRMVLSVFVENTRAQRFYARHGMREIGKYEFRVGDQIDDDRIWALDL